MRSWMTPTGLFRGGTGTYSMGSGPSGRGVAAAIGATPSDIARPAMPTPTAPALDEALETSISAAMAPGPKRMSSPVVGSSESLRAPDLQANPVFAEPDVFDFDEDMMYSQKSFMPQFNPQQFQTSAAHPTSQLGNKQIGAHNVPSLISGNPAAIADFREYLRRNPGMGFNDWMSAPTSGSGYSNAYKWV
jgi:hypothetical protein